MIQILKSVLIVGGFAILGSNQSMAFDHSHSGWNEVLKKSVTWTHSTSTVNYRDLKSNSKALDQYISEISDVKISGFEQWTRDEQLAFLINAYNALTVKLIIENYPVKSIKDIGGLFSSPWKKKFFRLLEKEGNLDWIEHEKIRPIYNEPRIHFALVCASIGCPGLRAEAFVAQKLNKQLDESVHRFLNDSARNRYDSTMKELALSSIFKWYKDDFVKAKGSIQAFIFPYMDSLKGENLSSAQNISIKYLDYDWSLNEK